MKLLLKAAGGHRPAHSQKLKKAWAEARHEEEGNEKESSRHLRHFLGRRQRY